MLGCVLDIFYKLTTIPHGSGNTKEMLSFIESFAKKHNYLTKKDKTNNILLYKANGNPKICFQSHYDMVCVGLAAQNQPLTLINNKIVSNGITQTWLKAKDSSLGSDNGMGMAIMMHFIKNQIDAEFLFTNDEEIGMIGARNLTIPIESSILINLDSEVLGEITVGCAGGFDFSYNAEFETKEIPQDWHYYILQSRNFAGGHSGIDINNKKEEFQNAILESAKFINAVLNHEYDGADSKIYILNWRGGEKRNSIPINSKIIFASKHELKISSNKFFEIKKLEHLNNEQLDSHNETFLKTPIGLDFNILKNILDNIKVGVLDIDGEAVQNSLNLSNISFANGNLSLAFMGRANTKELLDSNLRNLEGQLSKIYPSQKDKKAILKVSEYYAPWQKQSNSPDSNFKKTIDLMHKCMKKNLKPLKIEPEIVELHAGLECGILLSSLEKVGSKNIVALSIGPTINSPHSLNETVWIESVEIIIDILDDFMKEAV